MKICGRCKKELPLDDFGIVRSRPDGHNLYCKVCILEKATAQRERMRQMREGRKRFLPEVKKPIPKRLIVGTPNNRLVTAIQNGVHTRTELKYATRLHWDLLGEALAWGLQRGQFRIERVFDEPYFYLRVA